MLVVSEEYLQDARRQFEMDQAVYKSCMAGHGVNDVIVVLFDQLHDIRLLSCLRRGLTLNEALHWTPNNEDGRRLFWNQLHDRLTQNNSDQQPLNYI